LTDAEILKAVADGNNAPYRILVDRYKDRIAATIYGMLGPQADEAEDVGQEVFIRFFKAIPNFRGDAAVSTYLTRIAMNLSLNAIKKRQREQSRFRSIDEMDTDFADHSKTDDNVDRELVHKAIHKLPEHYRAVVVLRFMDGYSSQETADILKVPLGTVLSRLKRAQEKLKVILTPQLEV
jgi:RNA polymerase sigma-70 factor (ECF subfamily)